MNIHVAATALLPWNERFSWTELTKLSGYTLFLALMGGALVTLSIYLLTRDRGNTPAANGQHHQQSQDPAIVRSLVAGALVGVLIMLLVPSLYRQGDQVVNNGNASNSASASQQEIESLEDTIAGQLESRAASMGYEVLDTDVRDLTTTVQVGSCDVVLDMAGAVPQFIVIDDVIGVMRFDSLNPWPLLRDARQNLDHPLRRCFTRDQLDPTA